MLALNVTGLFGKRLNRTYSLNMREGTFTQTLTDAVNMTSFVARQRQYVHRRLRSLLVLELEVCVSWIIIKFFVSKSYYYFLSFLCCLHICPKTIYSYKYILRFCMQVEFLRSDNYSTNVITLQSLHGNATSEDLLANYNSPCPFRRHCVYVNATTRVPEDSNWGSVQSVRLFSHCVFVDSKLKSNNFVVRRTGACDCSSFTNWRDCPRAGAMLLEVRPNLSVIISSRFVIYR